ncbi:similar to An12g06670 [Aspergillus luchuensis IFO 4308]|nr:similar to An12g06670 [Aspergillus luchuensis IFO 4308]
MQAELKQEIEAKTRALNRALNEWKENGGSREDVDRSLFALFIAGRATNNRQIVQYFASLLRPNDGDDMSPSPSMPSTSYHNGFMPSPERSSSMGRDSVEDTTAGTESSRLNNLQPGPA